MVNLAQGGYTHEQIIKMLSQTGPDPQRDTGNIRIYRVRSGSVFDEIPCYSLHLECNTEDDVKYSGDFTLELPEDYNWVGDRIQPFQYHGDLEWPLSPPLWLPTRSTVKTYDRRRGVVVKPWTCTGYDESRFLLNNSLGSAEPYKKGTLYDSVLADLFEKASFTAYSIEPSDLVLQADRELEAGARLLALINGLLEEMNYTSLTPDRSGILRSGPYRSPREIPPEIHYTHIWPEVSEDYDGIDKPNYFIGYVSNPDLPGRWREEVPNSFPPSPLSVGNLGYTVTAPPVRYDEVASEEVLYGLVYREMEETSRSLKHSTFTFFPMPHHEAGEVMTVENQLMSGIYWESGWSITASRGQYEMQHRVRGVFHD